MATESWPGTLPEFVMAEQFGQKHKPQFIRTTMDRGPAKVRRRSTFEPIKQTHSVILDSTQVEAFETWFEVNLLGGVERFNKDDPISGVSKEYRFLDTPKLSSYGPVLFRLDMELERLT